MRKRMVDDKSALCGEYEDGQHLEKHEGKLRLRLFGLPTPKYELISREEDLKRRRI